VQAPGLDPALQKQILFSLITEIVSYDYEYQTQARIVLADIFPHGVVVAGTLKNH
jgi:hypothetical protein